MRKTQLLVGLGCLGCVFAGTALAPSTAHAQAATNFGAPGQLAISSDAQLSLLGQSYSGNGAPGNTFQLVLMPAADYFIIQNLSLGGYLEYAHQSQSGTNGGASTSSDTFGLGPRVGYDINISGSFSFWPKAFIGFSSTNFSTGNQSAAATTPGPSVSSRRSCSTRPSTSSWASGPSSRPSFRTASRREITAPRGPRRRPTASRSPSAAGCLSEG